LGGAQRRTRPMACVSRAMYVCSLSERVHEDGVVRRRAVVAGSGLSLQLEEDSRVFGTERLALQLRHRRHLVRRPLDHFAKGGPHRAAATRAPRQRRRWRNSRRRRRSIARTAALQPATEHCSREAARRSAVDFAAVAAAGEERNPQRLFRDGVDEQHRRAAPSSSRRARCSPETSKNASAPQRRAGSPTK